MIRLLPTLLALAAAALPAATLIQNATLLTVSHGTLQHASLLIEDGKIAAIGPNLTAPSGATVIDAHGLYVLPGIVDCHAHIAIDSINEGSVAVSSMVRIADVLRPRAPSLYRALAGGVTTANILHGSANPIGGQCTVIKLRPGGTAEDLLFKGAMPGIKFALGENPKRNSGPLHPDSRQGVNDVIRDAFLRARAYQASWSTYEEKKAAGRRAIPPRRDLQLEPLVEVLEGKRLVHAHS